MTATYALIVVRSVHVTEHCEPRTVGSRDDDIDGFVSIECH